MCYIYSDFLYLLFPTDGLALARWLANNWLRANLEILISIRRLQYVMHATGDSKRDQITRTDRSNGDQMRAEMICRPRN